MSHARRCWVLLPLVLGLLAIPAAAQPVAAERKSVEEAFFAYRTAILNDRGSEAVQHLSASTIDYFREMQQLALYGREEELRKQSTANLLQALLLRHRVPADDLARMSASDLLVYAIDRGWVGKNSVVALTVTDVRIDGEFALVDVASDRTAGKTMFRFNREHGRWKLDLRSIMQASSAVLEMTAKRQQMSRDELIFRLLSAVSGLQVDESIWQPLRQR